MLMAFLKSADSRKEASFAVRPGAKMKDLPPRPEHDAEDSRLPEEVRR